MCGAYRKLAYAALLLACSGNPSRFSSDGGRKRDGAVRDGSLDDGGGNLDGSNPSDSGGMGDGEAECVAGEARTCGTQVGECVEGIETCAGGLWGACEGSVDPEPEDCNDVDDDCNGTVDEGCLCAPDGVTRICGSDIGACEPGTQLCTSGLWALCEGGATPTEEICDGLDNDCDWAVDEGCPCTEGSTRSCGSSVGACEEGEQVCVDALWSECEGLMGPVTETCDEIDNDCDDTVDEGCDCTDGSSRLCGTSVGECSEGFQACEGGAWGACSDVGPEEESCADELDNDCDGIVNEGCSCAPVGAVESCGSDTGVCVAGTRTCTEDAVWSPCSNVGPSDEICDGLDNDCDATSDEGCPCAEGEVRVCGSSVGVCEEGTQSCVGGTWSVCSGDIAPVPEDCGDAVDNDCDGESNEGCPCPSPGTTEACGTGTGACEAGTRTCETGGWSSCSGVGPTDEICDDLDNDCDGEADEGWAIEIACDGADDDLCTLGITRCAEDGISIDCDDSGGASAEICDFGDNDCDGVVDEGFAVDEACDGADEDLCDEGVQGCSADGAATLCSDTSETNVERCDGIDNNCDEDTDEGFVLGGVCDGTDEDDCDEGAWVCTAGGEDVECSDTSSRIDELCDTLDNDCDGTVDEGFAIGVACDGADGDLCEEGVLVCAEDALGTRCSDETETDPERCDGPDGAGDDTDDDCDGVIDEGCTCPSEGAERSCGLEEGECAQGTQTCTTGAWSDCVGAVGPVAETCDSLDNDCDGESDEIFAVGIACDGTDDDDCQEGVSVCGDDGSGTTCDDTTGTAVEICDGEDNNCNGVIDEGYAVGVACDGADSDACSEGVTICGEDGESTGCSDESSDSAELCDGLDNDCDSTVDEGFALGGACDGTDSDACEGGTTVCGPDGLSTVCRETAGAALEVCDGEDNDCDGAVDEGYAVGLPCDGPDADFCNDGETVCRADGSGTVCNDTSSTNDEVCDSADNDCDGAVDEGFSLGESCDGGDTDLCDEGVLVCAGDGLSSVCNDDTGASVEACDGADNDCNGSTDEGCDCKAGETRSCGIDVPPCTTGTQSCLISGVFGSCSGVAPSEERCDGVDNDCDSVVDDPYALEVACDGADGDLCAEGATACNEDESGVVCEEVEETSVELCDSIDNDCDGTNNEGFTLGVACDGDDVDACADGITVCGPDGTGTVCNDDSEAGTERCNGVDDNCDGEVDEGYALGEACDGLDDDQCEEGVTVCSVDGTTVRCDEDLAANGELCNGVDDDCDGTIDEGFGLGVACDGADDDLCTDGTTVCTVDGTGTLCNDDPSSDGEVCDGEDNDCDGIADNGFPVGIACDGTDADLCQDATLACSEDGTSMVCDDTENNDEHIEQCDGVDNDCDGSIDEDCPCTDGETRECGVATPPCGLGTQICEGGFWGVCTGATLPSSEVCDGKDNDCDTTIDEDYALGIVCDGTDGDLCNEGVTVCSDDGSETTCNDATESNTELCDLLDNNCNGTIDEGYSVGGACDGSDLDLCAEGVTACSEDGTTTTCSDSTDTAPELCDGIDNDCDGVNNEGFALGAACDGSDGDACDEGVVVCAADGISTTCNDATSTNDELCDSLDNDCDGTTDEGYALGAACDGSDTDACAEGVMVCTLDGAGTECSDTTGTSVELCDDTDNDCDGTNNEGYPVGVACDGTDNDFCAEGTRICSGDGLATECDDDNDEHDLEECGDALDNDCDGSIDEGCACTDGATQDCGSATPPCTLGTQTCVGGTWGACEGGVLPTTELCDEIDNDCDTTVDEDFALGVDCDGTDGDLCNEGVTECSEDGASTTCSDETGSSVELCDAEDNDCNGTNNEGYTVGVACDGSDEDLCAQGVTVCSPDGTTTHCNDTTDTNIELCDGIDNDCDGVNNEDYALGVSCDGADADTCNEGVTVCGADGTTTTCNDSTSSNVELCDTVDNDCDGENNEGYGVGAACDGPDGDACAEGVVACRVDGTGTECSDTTGTSTELCDDTDNDCDGTNNEGYPVGIACDGTDDDLCPDARRVCSEDGTTTDCIDTETNEEQIEECDGVDNDCDGLIDNGCACETGSTQACGNSTPPCRVGTQNCVDGAWGACVGGVLPSTEVCDGVDNDCDTTTDEDFALGLACDGSDGDACEEGVTVCDGDGTDTTCDDATDTNIELCDAVDNDCDGTNNEGYSVGVACDGSDGDLCAEGVTVCSADGTTTDCNDTTETTIELCDGLDNDCDGVNNEGYTLGVACDGRDGDLCAEGVTVCGADGQSTTCNDSTSTSVELCDTIDNDCDGTTNEGFALGVACDGVDGDFCNEGVTQCTVDGSGTECNDTTGTTVELCDGTDNDCDGTNNEGYPVGVACDGADLDLCQEGQRVCSEDGASTECQEEPGNSQEVCGNDVDEDCDGLLNNGCTCTPGSTQPCGSDVGACEPGTQTCAAEGAWGLCESGTLPTSETCDGLDNDCDGDADEDFVLGVACDGTDGDLCNEGVTICNGDGTDTTCSDATDTTVELCDGVDNDCDGINNEGYAVGVACDGSDGDLCAEGVAVCSADGTTTNCNDTTDTNIELCDGIDNDCDGVNNEDYALGVACDGADGDLCNEGVIVCSADGTATTCNDITSTTVERCDLVDNDCDGENNEGFGEGAPCDGPDGDFCDEGIRVCSGDGQSIDCSDVTDTNVELCDDVDNDCDGTNNEGYPVGTACDGLDTDLCNEGTRVCSADRATTECSDDTSGTEEVCGNDIDEDCDGLLNNGCGCTPGLTQACGTDLGECQVGTQTCTEAGAWGPCEGGVLSTAELCDGLDNDCDALTDEDFALGVACDGSDADLCNEGVTVCDGSGTACNDATDTNVELCDAVDNDCDGTNNEGYSVGVACDGSDGDLCAEGVTVCSADGTATDCNDTTETTIELCDGIDNDCDGVNNEGYSLGVACDGADGDLCSEGVTVCGADGQSTTCNDSTSTNVELCDTIDNDCDGTTNEGFALGVACDGVDGDFCNEGVTQCTVEGLGTECNDTTGTTVELCDETDNDCDGTNNEGYPVGVACDGEDTDLCQEGHRVCSGDGTATDCDDTTGNSEEICNGVDDDCDGSIDEGIPCACTNGETRPCGTDVGECESGTQTCVDGAWGLCGGIGPTTEICDGLDNDCDGLVDEEFALGVACDGTDGDLCNEGVTVCSADGTGTTCNDATDTTIELCDGVDNDCDGINNEGYAVGVACDGSDGDLCAEGVTACSADGSSTTCNDTTGTNIELCDGIDNDCDGVNNEDYVLGVACDGPDGDECQEGVTVCSADGTTTTCNDSTSTTVELCDTVDNDCDGQNNEGFSIGASCDGPDGDFCLEGTLVCNGDGTGTDCSDTTPTNAELCDAIDNDCDGTNNEGFPVGVACDGLDADLCPEGVRVCSADGTTTVCDDETGDNIEQCDGDDDDCDGIIDNGCACTDGSTQACGNNTPPCVAGTQTCVAGAWGPCEGGVLPTAELCDGVDNDCDTTIDEDFALGVACDGTDDDLCNEGVTICNPDDPTATMCNDANDTDDERCDAIDNDCDGTNNEGFALGLACDGSDGDLCTEGVTVCSLDGTTTTCNDSTDTNVELCDGIDNDCDGENNEGFTLGVACDGSDGDLCLEGVTVCNGDGTSTICNDATSTNLEVCDGADNDCDGTTDEGFSLGVACDGPDGDFCNEGITVCTVDGASTECNDTSGTTEERCDATDNDCDGTNNEGFPVGVACDGTIDEDFCAEGHQVCTVDGMGTECDDPNDADPEVCGNGIDDDCDGVVDEGCPCTPPATESCGTDVGECVSGTRTCTAEGTWGACEGAVGPTSEICDGLDNDCDGLADEDFLPALGVACDGADGDQCLEGVTVCGGGAVVCNDTTGTTEERCDSVDNDCDGTNNEGFALGVLCDGADGDLCKEGVTVCSADGTATTCNDSTGTNVELCDSIDNDCDGTNNEGYSLGVPCDGADGDFCIEGVTECYFTQTSTICGDFTGTSVEVCNGVDDDCDGAIDEGFFFPSAPTIPLPAPGGTSTVTGSTSGMSDQVDACGAAGPEAWFVFSLPSADIVELDTVGTSFDTMLSIYSATSCGLGSVLACNNDGCGTSQSFIATLLSAGSYFVAVEPAGSSSGGGFKLNFSRSGTIAGTNITPLIGLPSTLAGSVSGSSSVRGSCGGNGPETAYWFYGCPGRTLNANTCGASVDSVIHLRKGTPTGGELACDDDSKTCPQDTGCCGTHGCYEGSTIPTPLLQSDGSYKPNPDESNLPCGASGRGLYFLWVDSFWTSCSGGFTLTYSYSSGSVGLCAGVPFTSRTLEGSVTVGAGRYSSLVVDGSDVVHIVDYLNGPTSSPGPQRIHYFQPSGGGLVVDSGPDPGVGWYPSIDVDGAGGVHISYSDQTANQDLKYAYRALGASSFTKEVVDSTGTRGYYTSIAVDNVGGVHISYYDYSASSDLRYAYKPAGGTWSTTVVDGTGYAGWYSSLDVDYLGGVHIAYAHQGSQRLRYLYKPAGGAFAAPVVVDSVTVGFCNSGYEYCGLGSGSPGGGNNEPPGPTGPHVSLKVDLSAGVHIAYADQSASEDIRYAYKPAGGSFSTTTIVSAGFHAFPSLALDASGGVHIAYADVGPELDIEYAYKAPGAGSFSILTLPVIDEGTTATTDDGFFAGGPTSIGVTSCGKVYITYRNLGTGSPLSSAGLVLANGCQ